MKRVPSVSPVPITVWGRDDKARAAAASASDQAPSRSLKFVRRRPRMTTILCGGISGILKFHGRLPIHRAQTGTKVRGVSVRTSLTSQSQQIIMNNIGIQQRLLQRSMSYMKAGTSSLRDFRTQNIWTEQ